MHTCIILKRHKTRLVFRESQHGLVAHNCQHVCDATVLLACYCCTNYYDLQVQASKEQLTSIPNLPIFRFPFLLIGDEFGNGCKMKFSQSTGCQPNEISAHSLFQNALCLTFDLDRNVAAICFPCFGFTGKQRIRIETGRQQQPFVSIRRPP